MLYTLGYSGWTPQAIQAEAQARNAVVCDIRLMRQLRVSRNGESVSLRSFWGPDTSRRRHSVTQLQKAGAHGALADDEAGKQVIAEILATYRALS